MGNKCNSNLKIIQSGLLWNLIAEFHEMWVVFFYWLRKHQCQGNTLAKYEVSELCDGEGKSGHCLAPSIGYLCIGFKKTECVFENRNLLSDPVNWRLLLIRDVANKCYLPIRAAQELRYPICVAVDSLSLVGCSHLACQRVGILGGWGSISLPLSLCCLAAEPLIAHWAWQAARTGGMKALFVILINLICNSSVKDVTD